MEFQSATAESNKITHFAEILLPVPIPGTFTYRVPFSFEPHLKIGQRVLVEFGRRRLYTGLVHSIHQNPPEKYDAKYILDLLEESPSVNELQFRFWEWMANYYMAFRGEVMQAALPSGLKLTSRSKIQLNPEFEYLEKEIELNEQEFKLVEALRTRPSMEFHEVEELLGIKTIHRIIKELSRKRVILIFEEVKEKYQPKQIKKIRVAPAYANSDEKLQELFELLSAKPKQEAVLLKVLSLLSTGKYGPNFSGAVEKSLITSDEAVSNSSLNTLIKNGYLQEGVEIVSRFQGKEYDLHFSTSRKEIELSELQLSAEKQILDQFSQKEVVLLHGITGSGKTEIYISLLQKALENGEQGLLLLPEIVLTVQIVARLKRVFGEQLGVYHSKFSDNERVEVWKGVQEGKFSIVVGVRSAIFLPFDHLGLIVIDEEHEPSFKQYDPAPRYHARDAAIMLASMHHAKVLLGSATPSAESYYLAQQGKFGLVELLKRHGEASLPAMKATDLRLERKRKKMKGEFSSELFEAIQTTLTQGKQVILFQNRRGYAHFLNCELCNWIPKCENCSVSLIYHQYRNELRCHYCGHKEAAPRACLSCGSTQLKTVGVGTEQIEENLKILFPEARIQRMDLDTTRAKYSYQQIIQDFENQQIDILVGTQMVSKGLDFDHVQLVGIFDADRMIHFPDFRAHERTFHQISQVSGRAGRKDQAGQVIIQTGNPKQPIIQWLLQHDYGSFFNKEIRERHTFHYPPFTRLIQLTLKHEDKKTAEDAALLLSKRILPKLGKKRVLGPESPIIDRIRNQFLQNLLIKIERGAGAKLPAIKTFLREECDHLLQQKAFKKVTITVDVDPV